MKKEKIQRIKVENICKSFDVDFKKDGRTLPRLISFIKKLPKNKFDVLKNVSFTADEGELLGIIGPNGSGKSTLLRIIAGIYTKDSGSVQTVGKMIYLSGFGQALSPKLSMKDNIFLIGAVMGLNPKDIRNKLDDIVELSGLKNFLNMKVYQFSSGMVSRLNFSIGIHCLKHHNPDILLLDEVFGSGGDIDFQTKSAKKMEEFVKGGATIILVSHKLDLIKKYCKRAIFLNKGEVVEIGPPEKIISTYINFAKKRRGF